MEPLGILLGIGEFDRNGMKAPPAGGRHPGQVGAGIGLPHPLDFLCVKLTQEAIDEQITPSGAVAGRGGLRRLLAE